MHLFVRPARPSARGQSTTRRVRADRGASSLEYALLVAAVAAVLIAVALGLASIVRDAFSSTHDCFDDRGTSSNCPKPSN